MHLTLVALGIFLVLLASGCTTSAPEVPARDQSTTSEPAIVAKEGIVCNAPYMRFGDGCCLDQDSNNICDTDETKACPFECCDGTLHQRKQCAYNQDCVNNVCANKACPFDCCDGITYQRRSCSTGFTCVNNACTSIPQAKLALSIDACKTSVNIFDGLGEVTDILATVTNFGTKEAQNIQITSSADDVGQVYYKSQGSIAVLPPGTSQPFQVTVDTTSQVQTTVHVTAFCSECGPPSIIASSSQCYTDWDALADKAKYVSLFLGI